MKKQKFVTYVQFLEDQKTYGKKTEGGVYDEKRLQLTMLN